MTLLVLTIHATITTDAMASFCHDLSIVFSAANMICPGMRKGLVVEFMDSVPVLASGNAMQHFAGSYALSILLTV